ncbi:ABC transporter ATP-binding protein [uncultured Prochlorococcus sp.]|uniref:ATP-binding cassette domain-containing protein n=1 Tax=uncultured Prochlorococcus sp. TaxID=159733 RepID=UPI00258B66D4|nr:ABC transporter ATP-binding protein [uncultured Prochlorococcus sp.]
MFFLLVIFVAIGEYFTIGESGIFAKNLLGLDIEKKAISFLGINHSLTFLLLILITNLGRAFVTYLGIKLSYVCSSQVCQKVYKNHLEQDYLDFLSSNSSELISIVTTKIEILSTNLILPLITISSSLLMMFFIGISIFRKSPIFTSFSFLAVFLGYLIISKVSTKSMRRNSQIISKNSSKNIKIVQESVNSFREIKLAGFEKRIHGIFSKNEISLRNAKTNVRVLSDLPRYIVETLIFTTIIIISLFFSYSSNNNYSIVIGSLGAFLYGSQRLLPLAQITYRSFSTIRSSTFSVKDIVKYLKIFNRNINTNQTNLDFSNKIELKGISFIYPNTKRKVINNLNLKIKKGEIVCIIGGSGSGKSTLIDIMMGLINTYDGILLIDNNEIKRNNVYSWTKKIAHVPQEILLLDDTVMKNIAFGIPEKDINKDLVNYALEVSALTEVIKGLKNGLETFVGERGSLLSGGQKQRIGIARAIYQKKEIIFLDEATSALDKKTEEEILTNIINIKPRQTIIMITHRPIVKIKYDNIIDLNT